MVHPLRRQVNLASLSGSEYRSLRKRLPQVRKNAKENTKAAGEPWIWMAAATRGPADFPVNTGENAAASTGATPGGGQFKGRYQVGGEVALFDAEFLRADSPSRPPAGRSAAVTG
jgi:hypothetical protein